MKITCDYCGASFETSENTSCPKCGGAYGKDAEMDARIQAQNLEEKKQELEAKQTEIEQRNKNMQITTIALTVVVLAIVLTITYTLVSGAKEAAVMLLNNII